MAVIKKNNTTTGADGRETWNIIKGRMRVFVKVFEDGSNSISTSIGRKDGDTWLNFYLPVYVSKECKVELLEGLNTIDVNNAFLSARKTKEGTPTGIQLIITDAVNLK